MNWKDYKHYTKEQLFAFLRFWNRISKVRGRTIKSLDKIIEDYDKENRILKKEIERLTEVK